VFDIANNTAWVSVGADHEYGSVRRRNHSPLVAWNGTGELSGGEATDEDRRLRRQ
jgi:hypothetical protein